MPEIMRDKKDLFESMPVNKALLKMTIPTIISQLINLIYNTVDAIFIGQTGDAYKTAAVTLAFTVFMMTIAFSNLFGTGGGSLIARLSGMGENGRAKSVCSFSFYGGIAVSLLYSLLVGLFMTPILNVLGASENTLEFAKQYVIYVVVIGNVPVIMSGICSHLLRNAGYSGKASVGLCIGGVLNMLLDPLFMFVLLPKGYEIVGAAVATLISNIISFVYLVVVMIRNESSTSLSVSLKDLKSVSSEDVREVFKVGIPSAILTGLFDIANVVLNKLMADHGDLELAAIGIVMKAERLPNAINIGICHGMLPIVAYNYASGNHKRLNAFIKTARIYGIAVSGFAIFIFSMFSANICRIFMSTSGEDAESALAVIEIASVFLLVRCLASPFQFINYNTSYCMQAVGYGSGTLIHACARELVFYIPLMYLLNHLFGVNGLASALVAGEFLGGVFALVIFAQWKKKHVGMF